MAVAICPVPNCSTELTHHCRRESGVGKQCTWVRCRTCHLVIDNRYWRAFNESTGCAVALPPRTP